MRIFKRVLCVCHVLSGCIFFSKLCFYAFVGYDLSDMVLNRDLSLAYGLNKYDFSAKGEKIRWKD